MNVTMELEAVPKREFMAAFDRYEPLVKGSSTIKKFKTCPRLYFYSTVLGFVPKDRPPYFTWGTAYHLFREVLEREYGFGDDAPKLFDEKKAQAALALAFNAGSNLWKTKGPRAGDLLNTKFEFMTDARLGQSFLTAYKHWEREKRQGRIKVIAVEQPFNMQLSNGDFTNGRADQIIEWNGKIWGRDFKTTSKKTDYYDRQLEPSDQFTRYTLGESRLVGHNIQGQFVELLYNSNPTKKSSEGPDIVEKQTSRTDYQLAQFEREDVLTHELIRTCRNADTWPMFEIACPFCPFRDVCTKPSELAQMAQLKLNYVVEPWDNTRTDED